MANKRLPKRITTRKSSRRNARATTGQYQFPSTRGDVPPMARLLFDTVSIRPPPRTDIFTTRLTTPTATLSAQAGATTTGNIIFTLNSLILDSSFQAVFDSYRIDAVRVTVKPQNNAIGLVANATVALVDFYSVIDYNSSGAAASAANFTKYDNCIILPPGEGCSRTFQPRSQTVVQTVAGTGFMPSTPMWCSIVNDDIQHYGYRYFIPATFVGQTTNQTWDLTVDYWISFKSVN